MNLAEAESVKKLCNQFRKDVITVLHERQTGHPGGSLSACEILTTLYFCEMHVDPANPSDPNRDRLVLSKGHAAPMLYRVLAEKGYFPVEELHTLRMLDSRLQGHPCMNATPGVDMSSGPLGIGLSAGVGMALALRNRTPVPRVYVILGDGELNEGTIWEACMAAAKFKTSNLCAVVDWNGVQLDGTADRIMPMGDLQKKFEAFGWNCIVCDGHDVQALCSAYQAARAYQDGPTVILAHTVKGKGVSYMEGQNAWHGKPIGDQAYADAMKQLSEL